MWGIHYTFKRDYGSSKLRSIVSKFENENEVCHDGIAVTIPNFNASGPVNCRLYSHALKKTYRCVTNNKFYSLGAAARSN